MDYPELVKFFAANKVREIQNVPEYVAYCAENVDAIGFRTALDRTEMAKKAIEDRLDSQPTRADQVRQALKVLKAQRLLDFDRYYDLIVAGYKPAWSAAQQQYFEHAAKIIRSGNYFFLSFTSRGPEGLSDKAVNRRYWYFIRPIVTQATKSDRKERNLLADAVDTILRDVSPEGFYYKRHDNDNSLVMRKLQEACESCLVFVQLVDRAMFDPPKEPNYCEFEYRTALNFIRQLGELDEKRVLFVVTESNPAGLPDPEDVHATYKEWVSYIRSKSAVYLPPATEYKKQVIDDIKQKLAAIALQVQEAKKNMLDQVPN